MGSGSGEGVPLEVLPALYLSVVAPLLVQSSGATLPNLSRPPLWSTHLAGVPTVLVESPGRGSCEERLWTTVVVELPSWHSKGGGFSGTALGHRPQNRAKGADPRTGNLKGEKWFCPGVLSSPCPGLPVPGFSWFRVAGSPALPLRVPLFFVPPHVSFYWPRASRSSSRREGRRGKRRGTDPRTGTGRRPKDQLFQVPSMYGFVVYIVAPGLFFPLHFAILFWRSWHCFPCMLELIGRLDSGSASFSTTRSSNGSFTQAASSYYPVVFLPLPIVPNHTASVPVFTRKPPVNVEEQPREECIASRPMELVVSVFRFTAQSRRKRTIYHARRNQFERFRGFWN